MIIITIRVCGLPACYHSASNEVSRFKPGLRGVNDGGMEGMYPPNNL